MTDEIFQNTQEFYSMNATFMPVGTTSKDNCCKQE